MAANAERRRWRGTALAAGLFAAGCLPATPSPAHRAAARIAETALALDAEVWEAPSADAAVAGVRDLVEEETRRAGGRADVLLLVDVTGSMRSAARAFAHAAEALEDALRLGGRIAVGGYRSYRDSFFLRVHPFAERPAALAAALASLKPWGGSRGSEPMWSALSEALHGLVWDPARTPVVVIVTDISPLEEPGARDGALGWLRARGARVHLVHVPPDLRIVVPPPPPRVAVGVALGALGHPDGDTRAATLYSAHVTIRSFERLLLGYDTLLTWRRRSDDDCVFPDHRAALRAGWSWPFLAFSAGIALRVTTGSSVCLTPDEPLRVLPAATLRVGPLIGPSIRAALHSADTEAVPGLPLTRAALVYETSRLRLGIGVGTAPPRGPAALYSLAVRLPSWFGSLDFGVEAFAGLSERTELGWGLSGSLAARSWFFPWERSRMRRRG